MPERIQRSRAKGWRMPDNAVYVGRPTMWGNPYSWLDEHYLGPAKWRRGAAVNDYTFALVQGLLPFNLADVERLRGRVLACWCSLDQPCHADVLLAFANRPLLCEGVPAREDSDG